ncbi:MAG TPA: hypothetical protein VGY53_08140, partial [Isosphaeraceae bacterium]|nr:hypothetical protein [Isosphaeraceae bacterium]
TLLDSQSQVMQNALVYGATSGAQAMLNGHIGGSAAFIDVVGVSSVTTGGTASIGGNLGIITGGGNDQVNLGGQMRSLYLDTGVGNDQVSVSALVDTSAEILLGPGDDTATLTGTIGDPGTQKGFLYLDGGPGNDSVTAASSFEINGIGIITLGTGNNTFILQPRGDQLAAIVIGGFGGTNTFVGNRNQLKYPPTGFQVFM